MDDVDDKIVITERSTDKIVLLYRSMALTAQTLVYGMYCLVVLIATYFMIKKGVKTKVSRWLLTMTLFMFFMSTLSWYSSMANLVMVIKEVNHVPDLLSLFNALTLVNYILADGIVLWRAWVLCRNDNRKSLFFAFFCFVSLILATIATIGVRIAIMLSSRTTPLIGAIGITQITTFCFSFATNMMSTFVVSLKVWRYRQEIRTTLGTGRAVEKVMILLIESGLLYAFAGLLFLGSFFIKTPVSALGNLYAPVNAQLAGIYPLMVLLVVKQQEQINAY
ncbi:hypothetical protein C8J56DRAFT_1169820 [Mycena floridula]|nr:hypothetical protein C8J56DRAFT_1169820 [Mycena floridula]